MSETTTRPVTGLAAMKLDELKGVASSMGIKGTTKMRKSDLVEAIKARRDRMAPLVYAVPVQLLAYYIAKERDLSPDKPRNLAKSVTVE